MEEWGVEEGWSVHACVCDDTAEVEDGGAASSFDFGRP